MINSRKHGISLTKKLSLYLIPFSVGIIFLAWVVLPIVMALLWSLVNPEYSWSYPDLFPKSFSLYHWKYIFKYSNIVSSIYNSLIIAVCSTLLSFVLSLPTAYALGRLDLKGKEIFKIIILIPLIFPGMSMALFLGRFLFMLGLSQTYIGVIMAHTLIGIPYMLRVLIVNFESLPQELIDAAENLGAGGMVKFTEIVLPLILPGIVSGSIFTFIMSMEEFNLTFVIGIPNINTIPTILFSYLGENFYRTAASVVSLILVIPNITALIITEQQIKTEYLGASLGKM